MSAYPFPIPEEAVKAVQSDPQLRPRSVWERYDGAPGNGAPWILSALEEWEDDLKGTVELLGGSVDNLNNRNLTKILLTREGYEPAPLMVIGKDQYDQLLTILSRFEDLNRDLQSLIGFSLKTWKHDPAVVARHEAQSEAAKEELQ